MNDWAKRVSQLQRLADTSLGAHKSNLIAIWQVHACNL